MITQVPGWSSVVRNGGITLTPPEGAHCGAIRYEERLRPLVPVRALIAAAQAQDPSFRTTAMRGPERLVTTEGEHAALVVLDGNLAGVGTPVQRCIGYVFGDDFYARIAGLALRADQFARFEDQVRKLVRGDQHFLGVRRRRFLFTPPAGYFGVERTFLHAYYYAPGFPREHAIVCVHPAIPLGMWQADDLPRHLRPIHGLAVEDITGPFARRTASLGGETWELRGTLDDRQPAVRTLVVLHDDRYAYPLSLDAHASRQAAHLARFNEVVESVQRIPGPGTAGTPTGTDKNPGELKALHHWL